MWVLYFLHCISLNKHIFVKNVFFNLCAIPYDPVNIIGIDLMMI